MAFNPTENRLGIQPIQVPVQATTLYQTGQSTQFYASQHRLGEIVRAIDPTYGGGEFIYLYGVASTILGSLVTYDPLNGTTTLAPSTVNLNKPVAVAMSACVSGYYGWYQIAGAAVIAKGAVSINPAVPLYVSNAAGAGKVSSTASNGKQVWSCISNNAATVPSGTATVAALISRPFLEGQIA
jgi:hypothetical protein